VGPVCHESQVRSGQIPSAQASESGEGVRRQRAAKRLKLHYEIKEYSYDNNWKWRAARPQTEQADRNP